MEKYQKGVDKDESDFIKFDSLCQKLGVPNTKQFLKIELQNPGEENKIVCDRRSRSFVRNYFLALFHYFGRPLAQATSAYGPANTNFRLVNGTNLRVGVSPAFPTLYFNTGSTGGANNTITVHRSVVDSTNGIFGVPEPGFSYVSTTDFASTGIVVGTGSRTESFNDTNLDVQILSSSIPGTSNRLFHQLPISSQPVYNTLTKTWTNSVSRVFNNNSGGNILVRETAIYFEFPSSDGFTSIPRYVMFTRDLLDSTLTVFNGGQLTVTYTWSIVFPA